MLKTVTERLDNLFRVTWQENGEIKFWTQAGWLEHLTTFPNGLCAKTCCRCPGVTISRFINCSNCLVVATTSFCFCPYSLQIMFTHIIFLDLHNPPVMFAATNRMEIFNLPISTEISPGGLFVITELWLFLLPPPLKYTNLLFLKEFSLQTFCFFSGHRTLYVGVRMPLGRQSHRHHRTHGQKHRRRMRGKGASQGEEGPEALAHGNTSGGRAGGRPQLGVPRDWGHVGQTSSR